MNHYEDSIRQANIDAAREQRILEESLRQARSMVVHKGGWCPFDGKTFCQESGQCEGCEIFIRMKGDAK